MSRESHQLADPAAELALLGSASRGGAEVLSGMVGTVGEDWFSTAPRQLAWRVLSGLIARGLPMDFVVIENEFISSGMEPRMAKDLCEAISRAVPTARNWPHYVDVLERWRMRRLGVALSRQMAEGFQNLEVDPKKLVGEIEAGMFELHSSRSRVTAQHRSVFIGRVIEEMATAFEQRGHVIGGVGTGYTDLDRLAIKGMRPGHFWLVGAPPGFGKTLLLSKILENISMGRGDYIEFKQKPIPVLLVSLEMDGYELAERDVVRGTRVSLAQMQQGLIARKVIQDMPAALTHMQAAPFYVLHVPGKSWEQIRILVKFAISQYGLQDAGPQCPRMIVGFDYVQAAHSDAKDAKGNRTREMQIISTGIDALAADTKTAWLVAAQLTRESFRGINPKSKTEPPRPGIADLRESGQLAQDADLVAIINPWWEKPADEDKGKAQKDWRKQASGDRDEDDEDDGFGPESDAPYGDYVGLDVPKNRHGANTHGKPMIKLKWDKAYFDFTSTNTRLWDATGKTSQQH